MLRRTLLGGAAGLVGLGSFVYRASPASAPQPAPHRPDPRSWPDRGLYAAWIGHTTVLLKIDGTTILTDPVWSTRVGIDLGLFTLGVKRLVEPALSLRELPHIDLVLLSHAHFDHFDTPTLRRLENRATDVITASKTGDLLRGSRYRSVRELGWEATASAGPLEIRAFRTRHWGARMRSDTYRGYNGYTIECGRYRVLFGGDTALTNAFALLKSSRPFDLAIMPVGAYNPWIHAHCTPEQAWQMSNHAGAEFVLPVHHQTFALSREPYLEPIERFQNAAAAHLDRVAVKHIGQEFSLKL